MNIVCLDMEGVLVPELWIAFAEESGVPELRRTTRDGLIVGALLLFPELIQLSKHLIRLLLSLPHDAPRLGLALGAGVLLGSWRDEPPRCTGSR